MSIKAKKILIITCAILAIISLIIVFVVIFTHKKYENLDGYVANISNYKSIGIGSKNTPKSNNQLNLIYADELNTNDDSVTSANLIGVKDDGAIEKIKFTKNDDEVEPIYNIFSFNQTSRYLLITYVIDGDAPKHIIKNYFFNYDEYVTYLIDKNTGLTFNLNFAEEYTLNFRQHGISSADCIDKIIMRFRQKYYKVGVENDELIVQEFYNNEIFDDNIEILLCDKFGNCILSNNYIYTKDGQIKPTNFIFNNNTYRGFDGLIHHENYVLTENGEFIESVDTIQHPIPTEFLIYSNNNDYYFYSPSLANFDGSCKWHFGDNVVKITKNGDTYTINLIPLNFGNLDSKKILINSNFVYAITGDYEITKVNYISEESEVINLTNNIILNKIKIYDSTTIEFVGVDYSLQKVQGTIKANGEISYSYTKPVFECYTILPLSL